MTTAQLHRCGLSSASISRWTRNGTLHRVGFGVYALGHQAGDDAARLAEGLLRAGPGAALSHTTAAWWRALLRYPSKHIHVSTPSRRRHAGVFRFHQPARIDREWHRGLPVTSATQTIVQIASMTTDAGLRRALAQADRAGWLDLDALQDELSHRPSGAKRLRHAIEHHLPELAETLSSLEDRFFLFCERHEIPLPVPNMEVNGYLVDAVWPEAGIAVELDGREEHGSPAAVVRDRRRELALRKANLEVIRYGAEQIDRTPSEAARDLKAAIRRGATRRRGSRRQEPPPPGGD